MRREGLSQEDCLAMLHRKDHVAFLDHFRRDRLRPMIQQVHSKGLRDTNGKIRRSNGLPYINTRREGKDPRMIPISTDLPEISLCERTTTNIPLAYEEDGPW